MKKIIALLLCLSMAVLLLVSCGDTPAEPTEEASTPVAQTTAQTTAPTPGTSETTASPTETTAQTVATTAETVPTETTVDEPPTVNLKTEALPGYEDMTFHGKTFIFATEDEAGGDNWYTDDEVYPSLDRTDAVSIAVRERNRLVEKLYDCKIDMVSAATPIDFAKADITSQKYTIDFYTSEYTSSSVATSGNNYNLLNYIDVTNEWWDKNYVRDLTVKTTTGVPVLCGIVGDFATSSFVAAHAIMFNQTLYENSGLPYDIYGLARTGDWTMDIFKEIVKSISNDTSGDQAYHYSDGDLIGWARTGHATHGMHVASALRLIDNENGNFFFAPAQHAEEWDTIINTAIDVWNVEGSETLGYSTIYAGIPAGKIAFASQIIGILEDSRLKDADNLYLGMVPYPKYSKQQGNYAHYVDNHVASYCMPISVTDPELCGTFLELFACHSRAIVREAFVETYSYTYCSNAECIDMMNIILDTRTYDPGYLWFTSYEGLVSNMISTGSNSIAGFAKRYATTFQSDYSNFVNTITDKYAK